MGLKAALGLALLASLAANLFLFGGLQRGHPTLDSQLAPIDRIEVIRTRGGLLQVSTIRAPETFEATRPHSLLGIDLGATTTQIRVPATYIYHIELAPEWKVTRRGKTWVVVAPAVKPNLPVAIDTSRLQRFAAGTWSLFTGTNELDALQRNITPILARKAASPSYIAFQREAARRTVGEFVAKWLAGPAQGAAGSGETIEVFFTDEPIAALAKVPLPVVTQEP